MPDPIWIPTTPEVYRAIYAQHRDDFSVFGTHTCDGGCMFHSEGYILTEWGFKGADAPIIRSIARGNRGESPDDPREWTYWLAKVKEDPDA